MFIDITYFINIRPKVIVVELEQSNMMLIIARIYNLIFTDTKIIPDCHTASYISNFTGKIGFSKIKKIIIRECYGIIIHNSETSNLNLHNRQFTIESKVPEAIRNDNATLDLENKKHITFITSFNPDEPIELILDITKEIKDEFLINLTGNYKKIDSNIFNDLQPNVRLRGYLNKKDYNYLLRNSSVIVVLTDRDYTLLYGGREAMTYNVPCVLSSNRCNSSYFYKGFILVNNSKNEILYGINDAIKNRNELKKYIEELHNEKLELWEKRVNFFLKNI